MGLHMLTQLTIRNYAIVESLDLELSQGMTAISGETGAGKSIMLDALGLTLGDRADSGSVRQGAERAEIIASFDISALPSAHKWLTEQELDLDGDCIVRRVITKEGRSRGYINGQPSPLSSLKELGEHLIAIHGQHEHQRLMKKEHHRELLDQFAQQQALASKVRQLYTQWHEQKQHLERLQTLDDEAQARVQLLSYQVEELNQLALGDDELSTLEVEHQELSQAGQILQNGHHALSLTADGEQDNCYQLLHQAIHQLIELPKGAATEQVIDLLSSAQIQIEEANQELRHYLDRVDINPARLTEVEERLSSIYEMARKHRVSAKELPGLHAQLAEELASLNSSDEAIASLEAEVKALFERYKQHADKLSKARQKAAKKLNALIDTELSELGMPAASFIATLNETAKPTPYGLEEIEFLIATNRGQPARALGKIASGGELSRISLAIQVITAQTATTPTLIFDEVDVGIGGAIAEVVGQKLRQLGERSQVMCVTHQPQVASQGHQHLFVSKKASRSNTQTQINALQQKDRIEEIARMLGGIDVTQRSREHAREMLGLG